MELWKESQLKQLSHANEVNCAYLIALNFFRNLGFKFCAFTTSSQTPEARYTQINLNNYPNDWNSEYEKQGFNSIDPVVAHCSQSTLPIVWSPEIFSKTPHLWQALQERGVQHGWSQSILDEDSGMCSMLSLARSHCPITPYELYENLGFTVFISRHLHALVTQTLPKKVPASPIPHLSPREIEVLKLSADGKTAYESARILNLSERTVNFHVHSAIQKLGVNNKIAAVIKAARSGAI